MALRPHGCAVRRGLPTQSGKQEAMMNAMTFRNREISAFAGMTEK